MNKKTMQSRSSVNFFEWKRRRLITRLREEWRMENEIKNYLLLDILFISYWWINWTEEQTEVNTERTFKKSAKIIKCSIFYWREKWWNGKNWKKWWNVEDGDDDSKSCLLHFTRTKTNADRYERLGSWRLQSRFMHQVNNYNSFSCLLWK